MKNILSVAALAFCGLCGASQAMGSSFCDAVSGNIVVNCGFETGDFTGWTIGGTTSDPIVMGLPEYYGVDGLDANSGNYGAYMSQDLFVGTSPVTLSQTLATTAGDMYSVSFFLEQDSAPTTVGYVHAFSAAFGGTTMLSLTPTVAVPGTVGSFTEYTYTETASAASTTLAFAFENDDNYWSFDDVSVTQIASATPEPSTAAMGGMALGAMLLLWSRRRLVNIHR
jgi:hypothetical protein